MTGSINMRKTSGHMKTKSNMASGNSHASFVQEAFRKLSVDSHHLLDLKQEQEIPGKLPRASFCHVCLYFSRSLLASYLTPEAWRVVNKLSHFEGPELKFNDSRAGSRFSPRARFARLHFVRRNSRLWRSQRK